MPDRLERYREMRDFSVTRKDDRNWFLIKRRDQAAARGDITQERPESVKKRKRGKRAPQGVPAFVAPMLATLVTEPPRGGDWLYEVKYDGYRMLARLSGAGARLGMAGARPRSASTMSGILPTMP